MRRSVHSQRPGLTETFATRLALKWFLFGMDVSGNTQKRNPHVILMLSIFGTKRALKAEWLGLYRPRPRSRLNIQFSRFIV